MIERKVTGRENLLNKARNERKKKKEKDECIMGEE